MTLFHYATFPLSGSNLAQLNVAFLASVWGTHFAISKWNLWKLHKKKPALSWAAICQLLSLEEKWFLCVYLDTGWLVMIGGHFIQEETNGSTKVQTEAHNAAASIYYCRVQMLQ